MSMPDFCGYDGRSNEDGSLRIYTEQECKDKNGNWSANGECNRPDVSISYACRELNSSTVAMLYQSRYMIGGVVLVGGLLAYRYNMLRK